MLLKLPGFRLKLGCVEASGRGGGIAQNIGSGQDGGEGTIDSRSVTGGFQGFSIIVRQISGGDGKKSKLPM
jgi:hypothetical protein